MTEEELQAIGREWLKVVAYVKQEGIEAEHEHVRFRDTDLSIKGGAILGFAGLMLAADLVFLSASPDSFIKLTSSCGNIGYGALMLLVAGSFCALTSIMISRKGRYHSAWSSFGLMKLYHDRRRLWLNASAVLTMAGTFLYLSAMGGLLVVGRCY